MASIKPAGNKHHPFIRTFRRLPSREQKHFIRWLESELYTHRKGLGKIAQRVMIILRTAKGEKDYPPSQQLSYLRQSLDTYLALRTVIDDKVLIDRMTIKAHFQLKDTVRAEKLFKAGASRLNDVPLPTPDTYRQLYDLHLTGQEGRPPTAEFSLEEILEDSHQLDRVFLIGKLQQACRAAAQRLVQPHSIQIPFLTEVLTAVNSEQIWQQDSLLQLYALAYRSLRHHDEADRKQLYQLLLANAAWLQQPELRDIFIVLLNQSIRRMNLGEPGFDQFCFHLFKLGLNQEILFSNGKLSGQTFTNIVLTGLKIQEYTWLASFLKTYAACLSSLDQRTTLPYCQANYHYETGNLGLASELLINYDYSAGSTTMQLQARLTLAKVYFDQGNTDLLDSHLNSLTVFLSRHDELGYHRKICNDFARLIRKLLYLPPGFSSEKRAKISAELAGIPVTSFRTWLLARLPQ